MRQKIPASGTYRRSNRRNGGFTVVPRHLAQNNKLSFETRGLLLYLLSKPDGWEGKAGDIEREGDIGYEKRRRLTMQAEEEGYLAYRKVRLENGQVNQFYEVYDEPLPAEMRTNSKDASTMPAISWQDYSQPTPEKPGSVDEPTPVKPSAAEPSAAEPSAAEPSAAEPGSNIIQNDKEQNDKRKNESVVQENEGEQPSKDERDIAMRLLMLRTGKTHDVHRGPELLAWVQNIRRLHGNPGMALLLAAHENPAEHGISRTWPLWKVEDAIFAKQQKPPQRFIPDMSLLQTTCEKQAREMVEAGKTPEEVWATLIANGNIMPTPIMQRLYPGWKKPVAMMKQHQQATGPLPGALAGASGD